MGFFDYGMMGGYMMWPFSSSLGFFSIVIALLLLAFWIWMIVDAARRKYLNDIEKVLWIVIVVLGQWVGALVYLLVIRMSNPRGLAKKK